jgi:hypothetical protein
MIKKYNNFILEKMGINKDVVAISDLVYDKIQSLPNKKGKIVIEKAEIPKTQYNIDQITISVDDNIVSHFNPSTSMSTPTGYKLFFNVRPSEYNVKGVTHHEINHGIDWIIKKEKGTKDYFFDWHKISDMKTDPNFSSKTTDNITRFLYMCYPTEIKSRLHDFYSRLKEGIKDNPNPTYQDLLNMTKEMEDRRTVIWVAYKKMIEFNIFEEINNGDIDKNKKSMTEVLKRYGMQYNNENLKKLQKFVNDKGLYYRNKLHKVISLVLEEKLNEK